MEKTMDAKINISPKIVEQNWYKSLGTIKLQF